MTDFLGNVHEYQESSLITMDPLDFEDMRRSMVSLPFSQFPSNPSASELITNLQSFHEMKSMYVQGVVGIQPMLESLLVQIDGCVKIQHATPILLPLDLDIPIDYDQEEEIMEPEEVPEDDIDDDVDDDVDVDVDDDDVDQDADNDAVGEETSKVESLQEDDDQDEKDQTSSSPSSPSSPTSPTDPEGEETEESNEPETMGEEQPETDDNPGEASDEPQSPLSSPRSSPDVGDDVSDADEYEPSSPVSPSPPATPVRRLRDPKIIEQEVADQRDPVAILSFVLDDYGSEPGEMALKLSNFKQYCPVSLVSNRKLVIGTYPVQFCGMAYFMATKSDQDAFVASPRSYLIDVPEIMVTEIPSRVVVIAAPFSGLSEQVKTLANDMNYTVVSAHSLLMDIEQLNHDAMEDLRMGKSTNTDAMLLEALRVRIEQIEVESVVPRIICEGFPDTPDQVAQLVDILHPDMVIAIKSEDSLLERLDHLYLDPGTMTYNYHPNGLSYERDLLETDMEFRKRLLAMHPKHNISLPVDAFVESYGEAHEMVLNAFEDFNVKVFQVNGGGDMEDVQGRLLRLINPFQIQATDDLPPPPDNNTDQLELGETKHYCPVTLKKYNALAPGEPSTAIALQDKVYYFVSEVERQKFQDNPSYYVGLAEDGPLNPPPPRFLIQGGFGSGKTTQALALSAKTGIPAIRIENIVLDLKPERVLHNLDLTEEELEELAVNRPVTSLSTTSSTYGVSPKDILRTSEEEEIQRIFQDPEMLAFILAKELKKPKYADTGFILYGRPLPLDTLSMLVNTPEYSLYPDMVIHLRINDDTALTRLYNENDVPLPTVPREGNEDLDDDQVAELQDEMLENALEDRKEAILNAQDGAAAEMDAADDFWNGECRVPCRDIDANPRMQNVTHVVLSTTASVLDDRASIFASCRRVYQGEVEDKLETGVWFKSKLSNYCPVLLKESQRAFSCGNHYMVNYRHHVYYLSTRNNMTLFMRNPNKYIANTSLPPLIMPRVAIIGPPRSGKTTLAKRLANDLGAVYVSCEIIIKRMSTQTHEVATEINQRLGSGQGLTADHLIHALPFVLEMADVKRLGFVLDGIPATFDQMRRLQNEHLIQLHQVISLQLPEDSETQVIQQRIAKQASKLKEGRIAPIRSYHELYSSEIAPSLDNLSMIHQHLDETQDCLWTLDATKSKWFLVSQAVEIVRSNVTQRQQRQSALETGGACRTYKMGLNPDSLAARQASFGAYCPVTYVDGEGLVWIEERGDFKQHRCEYQGAVYHLRGPEQVERFLADPQKFTTFTMPRYLPQRLDEGEAQFTKLDFAGFDVVAFTRDVDPQDEFAHFKEGKKNLVVSYGPSNFGFTNPENLAEFMRFPWKYNEATLPAKMPPIAKKPVLLDSMPTLGYLEQAVANAVIQALTDVGKIRPKYPFLSVEESALKYIALNLKANNPNYKPFVREKYQQLLQEFIEKCSLVNYLSENLSQEAMPFESGFSEEEVREEIAQQFGTQQTSSSRYTREYPAVVKRRKAQQMKKPSPPASSSSSSSPRTTKMANDQPTPSSSSSSSSSSRLVSKLQQAVSTDTMYAELQTKVSEYDEIRATNGRIVENLMT
eukprot:TRINITY_DN1054_c0_g2_i3.p1 TRINITY_DN1054_c0_g2~~TRINITY_DN1054_c0_g2_i3.p1  ORF type:complete len:1599 (+),score=647.91 TRINITY_DN1054_c0_g2_i3:968-5764(+)